MEVAIMLVVVPFDQNNKLALLLQRADITIIIGYITFDIHPFDFYSIDMNLDIVGFLVNVTRI